MDNTGYESRGCSDSEESSEIDSSLDISSDIHLVKYNIKTLHEEEEAKLDEIDQDGKKSGEHNRGRDLFYSITNGTDSASEASDFINTEGRSCMISWSSDSMDALEEDDLEVCSSSRPEFFHFYVPSLDKMHSEDKSVFYNEGEEEQRENEQAESDPFLCFLQASQRDESGTEQKDFSRCPGDTEVKEENEPSPFSLDCRLYDSNVMEYYSLCSNVSPANSLDKDSSPDKYYFKNLLTELEGEKRWDVTETSEVDTLVLDPPPGFGDSSSEEEFFDAADRLTPTETASGSKGVSMEHASKFSYLNDTHCFNSINNYMASQSEEEEPERGKETESPAKSLRKRRSFLQTNYTSQVTFPFSPSCSLVTIEKEPCLSSRSYSPTISSLQSTEGEPALLETKPLAHPTHWKETKNKNSTSSLIEMEPDTMETKSVTDAVVHSITAVRVTGQQESKPASYYEADVEDNKNLCNPLCLSDQKRRRSCSEVTSWLESITSNSQKEQVEVNRRNISQHSHPLCETDNSMTSIVKNEQKRRENRTRNAKAQDGPEFYHILDNVSQTEVLSPCVEVSFVPVTQGRSRQLVYPEAASSIPESKQSEQGVTSVETEKTEQRIINKGGNALFQERGCKNLHDESSREAEGKKYPGFSNTELRFDVNSISGILACFSMMSALKENKSHKASYFNSQQTGSVQRGEGEPLLESTDSDVLVLGEALPEVDGQYLPISSESFQNMYNPPESPNSQIVKDTSSLRVEFNDDQVWLHTTPLSKQERTLQRNQQPLLELLHRFLHHSNISGATREDPSVHSKQSFFCFNHNRDKNSSASNSMDSSLDFTSIKSVTVPKERVEKCSCHLSYATCFRGLDAEVDGENVNSEENISPSLPMTVPPSSVSLSSINLSPFSLHSPNMNSELQADESVTRSETHFKALSQLQDRTFNLPADFNQLQDNIQALKKIIEEFSGNGLKHLQDKCALQFSEEKYTLCAESRKLISSCQKVISRKQSPELMQDTVQETFQNLLQLTRACFQFVDCGCCMSRQAEVLSDLKAVVCTYNEFVQAASETCGKGCQDLSFQLLSHQCTALTAAVFCLTQQFRT
ncbi:FERM and PDZ domain-containing protein 1-like [Microcaecilia unicolor]|uniref:FERM and PDZ domain-containing protein 1-like n=1 Tax=Microcaecilia unicolor TaxID=1415580 RepID=A0A6P7X3K7_9AMPH|nr:FERM and PDZ domain-containing protein 1-like [Microcaecilia unicolor]